MRVLNLQVGQNEHVNKMLGEIMEEYEIKQAVREAATICPRPF